MGSKTEIWSINRSNQVWKGSAAGWERKPGLMRQVADSRPVTWNGIGWTLLQNPVEPRTNLVQIAIGRRDQIYGAGTRDEIYRWIPNANPSLSKWVKVKGNLKTISVGTDGSIGGVNSENQGLVRIIVGGCVTLGGSVKLNIDPAKNPDYDPDQPEAAIRSVSCGVWKGDSTGSVPQSAKPDQLVLAPGLILRV